MTDSASDVRAGEGHPLDFQRLYEQAPCGWFAMRLDGTIVHANAMMTALTGRDELVGTRFPDLLNAGGRIYYQTHCVPMLSISGAVREIALELRGTGGSTMPVLLNALLSSDGLVHATLFEATDRRSYENELLKARQEADRTAVLLREAQSGLQHAAQHDVLTGLPNRGRMTTLLVRELQDARPLAVAFIDLDRFKAVNDSLGHEAGDLLLSTIARRLQQVVGCHGTLGRWGGDEFLLLLYGLEEPVVEQLIKDLLIAVARPVDVGRMDVTVGASIGLAWPPEGATSADELVGKADDAMYRAKGLGRNTFQVADRATPAVPQDLGGLLSDLRAGIARGELRLHYQPRVHLRTGSITGVEALVRWQHPERGLLPPAVFIDVAERSDLIRDIDAWVLRTAVQQGATWNNRRRLDMAVNFSATELSDSDLPERVLRTLTACGLPPERLTIEVTETALLIDTPAALANARRLRSHGVRLALDDFGTGYSGFTYLRQLPVDELKIDRSCVNGLTSQPSERAIVRGTIAMGHELGLQVVAEGVELPEQDAALIAMGCDVAQGFLYLHPLSAEDVEPFLPNSEQVRPLVRPSAQAAQ